MSEIRVAIVGVGRTKITRKGDRAIGALAVEAYRDMGYLPEAMRNYLLRLGWSPENSIPGMVDSLLRKREAESRKPGAPPGVAPPNTVPSTAAPRESGQR